VDGWSAGFSLFDTGGIFGYLVAKGFRTSEIERLSATEARIVYRCLSWDADHSEPMKVRKGKKK